MRERQSDEGPGVDAVESRCGRRREATYACSRVLMKLQTQIVPHIFVVQGPLSFPPSFLLGNHVVQRCLQRLGPSGDSQFIYDVAASRCLEIATHRHGCCVLQRCIDHATPVQKKVLVEAISVHALALSQDQVGRTRIALWLLQWIDRVPE